VQDDHQDERGADKPDEGGAEQGGRDSEHLHAMVAVAMQLW
jgi:hypothetical protein